MAIINLLKLHNRCKQSVRSAMREVGLVRCKNGLRYAYSDNGAPVLAVAHLDSVQHCTHFQEVDDRVYCPTLDDRLGVYTILDVLPRLGIKVDVLLTEGEESFQSTAVYFECKKQYNWLVEFDRRGSDAVLYDFDWQATVKDYYKIGLGSFSDLCWLDDLGCQAVNIGIGYYDEHSKYAYFDREEYELQIARFLPFYFDLKDKHYPYTPKPYSHDLSMSHGASYTWELDEAEEALYSCPKCNEEFYGFETATTRGAALCPNCHTWCSLEDQLSDELSETARHIRAITQEVDNSIIDM